MKAYKRILCVFLAVVLLFFGVNNSYFSPHKMDTVEASSIVVGGAVITIDFVIKIIAALAVAGLGVGIIVEWSDVDLEAVLEDFHSWLKENTAILDSLNIDGTSALKEWAVSDSWYVIEGGASGGSDPSPSPDNENDKHGLSTAFKVGAGVAAGGATLTSILAPISYVAEYDHYVDTEGNVLDSDDPRIKEAAMDSASLAIAQAYMQSKIDTMGTDSAGSDPVTQALQSRYIGDGLPYYSGELVQDTSGNYSYSVYSTYGTQTSAYIDEFQVYYEGTINTPYRICGVLSRSQNSATNDCYYSINFWYFNNNGSFELLSIPITRNYLFSYYSSVPSSDISSSTSISGYEMIPRCNFPIFEMDNSDSSAWKKYLLTGDDTGCINRERSHNYIDTDDDYGWASTAGITPADLAAAMPEAIGNLSGRGVSIFNVMKAINALKNKLEEENPNTGVSGEPAGVVLVPYPNVDDYTDALSSVINDPAVFPKVDDVVNPAPNPGTDDVVDSGEDVEISKDYTGILGLIIGILESILQAIKDFMSWFIIDFAAIKEHILLALDSVPAFTGYEDFLAIVDSAKGQITNSYEYPVITIVCPEILRPYWKQEQIILLDFEDYATYFIWVRTAMAFAILFGFALWFIKDIKVSFTLN